MTPRVLALLAVLAALAACGRDVPPPPAATDEVAEALAWLEGEREGAEVVRWSSHPALDALLAMDEEALQERVTRCLRAGLEQGDLPTVRASLAALRRHFGGEGRAGGRLLSAVAVHDAVRVGALDEARRRMEVPAPDEAGAEAWLALAIGLEGGRAPEARQAGVARWVRLRTAEDLTLDRAGPEGGRVLVWADDMLLGEARLLGTLARWAAKGAEVGLRVELVPIRRGSRRVGIRRHAAAPAEERASLAERLAGTGILLAPAFVESAWAERQLGLGGEEGAIVVLARDGRIVARRAGRLDDLTSLEGWVEKAASR